MWYLFELIKAIQTANRNAIDYLLCPIPIDSAISIIMPEILDSCEGAIFKTVKGHYIKSVQNDFMMLIAHKTEYEFSTYWKAIRELDKLCKNVNIIDELKTYNNQDKSLTLLEFAQFYEQEVIQKIILSDSSEKYTR